MLDERTYTITVLSDQDRNIPKNFYAYRRQKDFKKILLDGVLLDDEDTHDHDNKDEDEGGEKDEDDNENKEDDHPKNADLTNVILH